MRLRLASLFLLLAIFLFSASPIFSTTIPEVILTVPDIVTGPGVQNGVLEIYVDNYFDSIVGFQFTLQSLQPDLVTFDFSLGGIDTAGTLVSGFEFVALTSLSNDDSKVRFQCLADLPFNPAITPGFPPQQGNVALRLFFKTSDSVDITGELSSFLLIGWPFDFSDPQGNSIGTVIDTTADTSFFECTEWLDDDLCVAFQELPDGTNGWDSIYVELTLRGYTDTTILIPVHGSITIDPPRINCDLDYSETVDIVDLTCAVDYLFGSTSCAGEMCDANNDGNRDITDLTYFIDYLFRGGPPPQ